MPVYIFTKGFNEGLDAIPFGWSAVKIIPAVVLIYLLKVFFNGASTKSERNMHSKVVMVTVSGISPTVSYLLTI